MPIILFSSPGEFYGGSVSFVLVSGGLNFISWVVVSFPQTKLSTYTCDTNKSLSGPRLQSPRGTLRPASPICCAGTRWGPYPVRSVLGRTAAVQMKRREWTNRVDFLSGRWDVGPRIWSATVSCCCRKWRGGGPCWIHFTKLLLFILFYFEVEEHLEQLGRCALCAAAYAIDRLRQSVLQLGWLSCLRMQF
jgi:hypothetical protein